MAFSTPAKESWSASRSTGTKQPLVGRDGAADVVEMVLHDFLAVEARVDRGHDLERVDDRLHEERHEAELDLVLLDEAVLELRPQRDDAGEIDFVERGQVRRFLLRAEEARGDFLAHGDIFLREVRSPAGRGSGGGRMAPPPLGAAFGGGQHIALEDASVLAGACDRGGIDPLFLGLITHGGGKIVRIFAPGPAATGAAASTREGFSFAPLAASFFATGAASFYGALRRSGSGAFSSMLATTWPICTVSPALTRCLSWPALSATISEVTLSVSISKIGSPALT
jgi:hypothetical protein